MRAIASMLVFVAAAACAEQGDMTAGKQANPAPAKPALIHESDRAAVETLVREFSGDSAATISVTKVAGEGVCGTARINGQPRKFYVDIVDDEAFIEKMFPGADALIAAAC